MRGIWFSRGALILAAAALAGCATGPTPTPKSEPVFYPPPPQPPRIQHLATFSGERDLAPLPTGGFAQFILGEDRTSQRLNRPYGVALFEGKIYVADSRAPGLGVFDLAQKRFTVVTGSGQGRMKRPINVTIDLDGTKYVTDTGRDQILVYDRDDRFVAAFGVQGQFKPVDTAIAGERLYVADLQHHEVQVLDKHSGRLLFKFGSKGSKRGELFLPTNLAFGPEGDVYVVETGNFRVQRFTAEGQPVRVYGEVGNQPGSFARPKGIALDRTGRMYVGDAAFQNVQIFDSDGKLLLFFGQAGEAGEALSLPAGVSINYDDAHLFQRYANPGFIIEYVILVASQFGPNKVDVFGFGKMGGVDYGRGDAPAAAPPR